MSTPVPPHNIEAEQAALGAVLLNREAMLPLVALVPTASAFYLARHQVIYQAMLDLHNQRVPCDIKTVAGRLTERGQLDAVGGIAYLSQLSDNTLSSHAEHYAAQVAKAAYHRSLIAAGGRIAALGYDESLSVDELSAQAQAELNRTIQVATKTDFVSIGTALDELLQQVTADTLPGLATGYRDLDLLTGGLRPSELTLLAARPGIGKTSMLLCIADNVAQVGEPVLIFSLEMNRTMLVQRLAAPKLGIALTKLRDRHLSDDEVSRLVGLVGEVNDGRLPIYIDDTPGRSVSAMRGACLRWAAEHGRPPALIAIDYLQLADPGERYRGNKVQEVSETSRGLVKLARELDVPVLALSQLSRAVEGRADKVPILSDLRESGALEQDAANVWFIYREEVHDPESDKKGVAEIHVAKQRQGPLGVVPLRFDAATTRFYNLTYRMPEGY